MTEAVTTRIHELGYLAGRSPITIAAASIYLVTILAGEPRNARRISVTAGVSDVTIKHSFKELLKVQKEVLTPEILAKDKRLDIARLESP